MLGATLALGAVIAATVALGAAAWSWGTAPGSEARQGSRVVRVVSWAGFGFALMTWWGIVLAELGAFSMAAFVGTPAFAALAALAAYRSGRGEASRSRRAEPAAGWLNELGDLTVVGVLVAIGLWHFLPAFDVRLEARDPGVYHLAGVNLARTGGLTWYDRTVQELDAEQREAFFPYLVRPWDSQWGQRFIGFYLSSRESGRVLPQALPAYPVWVALGYAMGGQEAASRAGPALATLSLLLFYLLARSVAGPLPAAVAAVLLSLNAAQGWFARYSAAEMAAQPLALAGLFAAVRHRRYGASFDGIYAGVAIGLLMLAKAELSMIVIPLALLALYDAWQRGFDRRWFARFWLPLGLVALHALVHGLHLLWPYYGDIVYKALLTPASFAALAVAGSAALVAGATAAGLLGPWVRGRVGEPLRARVAAGARIALGCAVIALGVAGYWWRPRRDGAAMLDGWDAFNFVELAMTTSPFLLILAIAGAGLLIVRGRREDAPLILLATFVAGLTLWLRQIMPELPWAYRRWIPLTIPAIYLWAAVAVQVAAGAAIRLGRFEGATRAGISVVTASSLLLSVGVHWRATAPYASHREMPGSGRILDDVEELVEPGSLLLFEPRTRRGLIRFEAALALERGYRVLRIPTVSIDPALVRAVVWNEYVRRRPPPYLFTTGYLDSLPGVTAEPAGDFSGTTERLTSWVSAERVNAGQPVALPLGIEELVFRFRVYRLRPDHSDASLTGQLDVGNWDDLYVDGTTVHEPEINPNGRTYRWTKSTGGFYLPGLDASARQLVVQVERGDPEGMDKSMRVQLDGLDLGEVALGPDWHAYRFAIPEDWQLSPERWPRLDLLTQAFQPASFGLGPDSRSLGIKVALIRWSGAPATGQR